MESDGRLVGQLIWRIALWVGINIYLFWSIGFSAAVSTLGLIWLVGGTAFIFVIWSTIASFGERLWLMLTASFLQGNYYLWRVFEGVAMYVISKSIISSIL